MEEWGEGSFGPGSPFTPVQELSQEFTDFGGAWIVLELSPLDLDYLYFLTSWSRHLTTRQQNRPNRDRGAQRNQGAGQVGHLAPQGSHTAEAVAPRSNFLQKQIEFQISQKIMAAYHQHLPGAVAFWEVQRLQSWMKKSHYDNFQE